MRKWQQSSFDSVYEASAMCLGCVSNSVTMKMLSLGVIIINQDRVGSLQYFEELMWHTVPGCELVKLLLRWYWQWNWMWCMLSDNWKEIHATCLKPMPRTIRIIELQSSGLRILGFRCYNFIWSLPRGKQKGQGSILYPAVCLSPIWCHLHESDSTFVSYRPLSSLTAQWFWQPGITV